jgi:membrane-associated protease RseP (regulator of RpoE activity)
MRLPRQVVLAAGLLLAVGGGVVVAGCGSEPPPAPKVEGEPVEKIGENRFGVRRAWLADLTSEKAWFGMEAARALVAAEEGGVRGLRVGSHPGSALASLGLNNGDLLRSVNNREVTDAADAAKALGGLSGGGNFTLEVIRKGQPQTLIYEVR